MLPGSYHDKTHNSFKLAISYLGVAATWRQAKAPNATASIVCGFKTAGRQDTEVVNAYGMNAVIMTLDADDFPTTKPEKFDKISVKSTSYTVDACHPISLNAEVIGYKVFCRGVSS